MTQRQQTDLANPYDPVVGPHAVRSRSAGRAAVGLIALGGAGAAGLPVGWAAEEPARYSSPFLSPYDDEEPDEPAVEPAPEEVPPGSGEGERPGG